MTVSFATVAYNLRSLHESGNTALNVWNHNWYLTILCEFQLRFRKCSIQFELAERERARDKSEKSDQQ